MLFKCVNSISVLWKNFFLTLSSVVWMKWQLHMRIIFAVDISLKQWHKVPSLMNVVNLPPSYMEIGFFSEFPYQVQTFWTAMVQSSANKGKKVNSLLMKRRKGMEMCIKSKKCQIKWEEKKNVQQTDNKRRCNQLLWQLLAIYTHLPVFRMIFDT